MSGKGNRPVAFRPVPRGKMLTSSSKARQDIKRSRPESQNTLGVAKVINIDYEEFFVTLRTLTGVSQMYERVPIPLTFPGAGTRHFLGAMPQIGDYCIVGWMTQESGSPEVTKIPVVLSWVVPGVWPGRDWAMTAGLEADEYDMEAPREQKVTEGVFDRIRHKLRHIHPGNIVASSGQGSDLVLDEGVTLANRRGNEIRLRDQDQAVVTRALQRFDALAGSRTYAGMVQRDATFLAPSMVSDGREWDGPLQSVAGQPLTDSSLPADATAPDGFLTPARILRKNVLPEDQGLLGRAVLPVDGHIDPYNFLRRGGFINDAGFAIDPAVRSNASYGGKPMFRVTSQGGGNAVLDSDAPTLTEHRIEMTHTSDGRLPVTEQTDMFDAERLPNRDQDTGQGEGFPPNMPFIEWVLGSVVGNDPFTQEGRRKYGLPIVPVVFDGRTPAPKLEAASIVPEGSGLPSTPIGEHAAFLFHLIPPVPEGSSDTFWAVNKKGQVRAAIGGDIKENSVEAYTEGGFKLGVGGRFEILTNGHIKYGTLGKSSMEFTATEGSVKIYGGGPLKDETATVERLSGTGRGDGDLPAVDIEAQTNLWLQARKRMFLKGNEIEANATAVSIVGHDSIALNSAKQVDVTAETMMVSVSGKCQEGYGGPKYGLPTALPLHERTYIPFYPGMLCERVLYAMGDREELFLLGNHRTLMAIGNMTYTIGTGFWQTTAMTSTLTMGATGINGAAAAGVVSLTAASGVASMTGLAAANLVATGGVAQVRGSAGVVLAGPITGPDAGPIVCAGSLEPFTNLPFGTWGLGAKSHNVTP